MNTYWRKNISNPDVTPWLDWLSMGIKRYEGRLNKEDWAKMAVGDTLCLYSTESEAEFEICEIKNYTTFAEAFEDLGELIVPGVDQTTSTVTDLYSKYFSTTDIKTYGVIAIRLNKI